MRSLPKSKRPRIPKEFLGAFKAGHRPAAREYIDDELSYKLLNQIIDSNYTDAEAIEALSYICRFNNEFHKAALNQHDPKRLHRTKKQRKDCYDRSNARRRDLSSVKKHLLTPLDVAGEGPNRDLSGRLQADSDEHYSSYQEFLNRNRNLTSYEEGLIELVSLKIENDRIKIKN